MRRITACALVALVIAGCATQPPAQTAAVGDKIVCHNDTVTGSRFTHRICETQAQKDARERGTQDVRDTLMRPPAVGCAPGNSKLCSGGG